MRLPSVGVVREPSVRSRDPSRPLTSTQLLGMAYEDWNEIEDEDKDELQDASVGSHTARPLHVLIQLSSSGSRVNAM